MVVAARSSKCRKSKEGERRVPGISKLEVRESIECGERGNTATYVLKTKLLRICWGNYRREVERWCGVRLGTGWNGTEGESPSLLHHCAGGDDPTTSGTGSDDEESEGGGGGLAR